MTGENLFLNTLAVLVVTLCLPMIGRTQDLHAQNQRWGLDLSLNAVERFEADLGDSSFDLSRQQMRVEKNLVQNRKLILGLSASGGIWDYNFTGPQPDIWSDPWNTVQNVDFGLRFILPGNGRWSYFLASRLDWSWEEGADTTEGLVSGIIASAAYHFRYDRRLGFGGAVFRGLEERRFFPYIAVSWKLRENLTLQNPLNAGPAGPAGLELVYDTSGKWQFGGGGAYRSFRFRLDDEGIAPDGIGEMAGFPVWLRTSWQATGKLDLGIYAGTVLAGEAVIEDRHGRELGSEHIGPAPLAAVTLEWKL